MTLPWPTVSIVASEDSSGKISPGSPGSLYTGFIPEIAVYLSGVLNFTLEPYLQPDGKYGDDPDSGSSCVGDLQRGKADLSTAGLWASLERAQVVDILSPLLNDKATLYRLRGNRKQLNFWAYLNGISVRAWTAMGLSVCLCTAAIWAIENLWRRQQLKQQLDLAEAAAYAGVNLLQREYQLPLPPAAAAAAAAASTASRMALFVTSLLAFALFTVYSAVFTSTMTSLPQPPPIRSFQVRVKESYYSQFFNLLYSTLRG